MSNIQYKEKVKVSPYSDYYAIIDKSEHTDKTPILVIVDSKYRYTTIVSKKQHATNKENNLVHNANKFKVSTIIVPRLEDLTLETCQIAFDTVCSKIAIVELPLVKTSKGGVSQIDEIVQEFS